MLTRKYPLKDDMKPFDEKNIHAFRERKLLQLLAEENRPVKMVSFMQKYYRQFKFPGKKINSGFFRKFLTQVMKQGLISKTIVKGKSYISIPKQLPETSVLDATSGSTTDDLKPDQHTHELREANTTGTEKVVPFQTLVERTAEKKNMNSLMKDTAEGQKMVSTKGNIAGQKKDIRTMMYQSLFELETELGQLDVAFERIFCEKMALREELSQIQQEIFRRISGQ